MTEPWDSVNSGVVSLRSLRLALLIGTLKSMVSYIGNAYLEAETKRACLIYCLLNLCSP